MALLQPLSGPTGVRVDPILAHNFLVSLIDTTSTLSIVKSAAMSAVGDVALGGFTECAGLEMSLKLEEYNEGGRNGGALRFPTRVAWTNITLKKGLSAGRALWDWHYGFVQGTGRRRDGIITLLSDLHVPQAVWYFRRGLPVKYTAPAMNATQNTVAIESIEIAHEGIYQVPGAGYAGAAVGAALGAALGG